MPRVSWLWPGAMKFETPVLSVTERAAASPRIEANGVHIWPNGSMICLRQCDSAESREYSPGTPRKTQFRGALNAESAVVGKQNPRVFANGVIGSNSEVVRERLVKLTL